MSIHNRFLTLLVAALCALTGFGRTTDNRTFNRFYHLSPKEFEQQLQYYTDHELTDSAMLCANIQANKYGKERLTSEEVKACCFAYLFMSMDYLDHYCDYHTAAENLLKAEQIADKHELKKYQPLIAVNEATLTAIHNDLENNFAFNKKVIDEFKNAFYRTLDQVKSDNSETNKSLMELAASNMLYFAIKFDRINEVDNEVKAYRKTQKLYGTNCNIAELFCQAIVICKTGEYEKAFEALETPVDCPDYFNERDSLLLQSMAIMTQYAILLKSGKRAEALKLLLRQEQSLREKGMTFERLEALQLIKQHYEQESNESLADKYALIYYTTKDEFINKSRVGKIDHAKLNLELEQTRERIREMSYRQKLWEHKPLTDFWRVGKGYARRLESAGLQTMGDIALCSEHDEDYLYKIHAFFSFRISSLLTILYHHHEVQYLLHLVVVVISLFRQEFAVKHHHFLQHFLSHLHLFLYFLFFCHNILSLRFEQIF